MLCGDHQFFYAVSGRTDAGNISVQCKNAYEKGVQIFSALLFQRVKKAIGFFARFKYATFFVKLTLHEKSRYARQKVRTGHF